MTTFAVLSWKIINPKTPDWQLDAVCLTKEEAHRVMRDMQVSDPIDGPATAYQIVEYGAWKKHNQLETCTNV
jgi:hypothetical protein